MRQLGLMALRIFATTGCLSYVNYKYGISLGTDIIICALCLLWAITSYIEGVNFGASLTDGSENETDQNE